MPGDQIVGKVELPIRASDELLFMSTETLFGPDAPDVPFGSQENTRRLKALEIVTRVDFVIGDQLPEWRIYSEYQAMCALAARSALEGITMGADDERRRILVGLEMSEEELEATIQANKEARILEVLAKDISNG